MEFAVETKKLTKIYGQNVGVSSLDLHIPRGVIYGLLGPNGAGKTTTFNICCGFIKQSSGIVKVFGERLTEKTRLSHRVLALPQECNLPGSYKVGELLQYLGRLSGYSKTEARSIGKDLLKKVQLEDREDDRVRNLSHGMKKRVEVAQAFMGEPELIFLDEPTAGLDPQNAKSIRDLIRSFKTKSTVVFSSHNLPEIQEVCNYVGILKDGSLVAEGTVEDITHFHEEVIFSVPARSNNERVIKDLESLVQIKTVHCDNETNELRVEFDSKKITAEEMISKIIEALQKEKIPISGIRKGKTLEEKYLELM